MNLTSFLSSSQQAFLIAFAFYPISFYISLPKEVSPARLAKSREAISIFHCSLMAILSLICLQTSSVSTLLENPAAVTQRSSSQAPVEDKDLPVIVARSQFANAITAIETAYLLQDSAVLFCADQLNRRVRSKGIRPTKGLNIKHLAWHHAGLSAAFGVLQWYIYDGREKGILVIIMMMLMNISSPFGTVRWYLINFRPYWKLGITLATLCYLSIYAFCRVYLIYYILEVFGAQKSQSAFQTYRSLRWQCQAGTGTMAIVNTSWLASGVISFARRILMDGKEPKKRS